MVTKNLYYLLGVCVACVVGLISPSLLQAQVTATNQELAIEIDNPISNVSSVSSLVETAMEIVMKIGIPLLVLMVVYSGALYLFAQGNPNKIKEAHTALTYTLIGGVILLASWGIMQMIYSALISVTAFEYSMLLFV